MYCNVNSRGHKAKMDQEYCIKKFVVFYVVYKYNVAMLWLYTKITNSSTSSQKRCEDFNSNRSNIPQSFSLLSSPFPPLSSIPASLSSFRHCCVGLCSGRRYFNKSACFLSLSLISHSMFAVLYKDRQWDGAVL